MAETLLPTPDAYSADRSGAQSPEKRRAGGHSVTLADAATELFPTPRATDGTHGGPNQSGSSGDLMLPLAVTHLLPTPAVNDMGAGKTVEAWDEWTAKMRTAHGNGNGHGPSLHIEAARLPEQEWGKYAPAVRRWEALTRPAPPPTVLGPKGGHRLNPVFVEWMMGLPPGHVTDVPGTTRNDQLKALGNGVCPQQAAAAIRSLLGGAAVEGAAG